MIHQTFIWNGTVSGLVAVVICNVRYNCMGKHTKQSKLFQKKILTFTSFVALNDVKTEYLRCLWQQTT